MPNQADISIIIPCYNMEKYVGIALESILVQEGITIEILVIDDFSTDSTKQIVQQYAQRYENIHFFENERVKGVSGARNTGLAHVSGKTCFFLDADDLLLKNSLISLFNLFQQKKTPIVQGGLTIFCHQRLLCFSPVVNSKSDKFTYPNVHFAQNLYCSDFLKKNNILFPEDCAIGEDNTFFCKVFSTAFEKAVDIPLVEHPVYFYRINHKKSNPLSRHALSYINHFHYVRQILSHHSKMEFFPSYVQNQLPKTWISYLYFTLKDDPTQADRYLASFASTFADLKESIAPLIAQDLKELSENFWEACQAHNTNDMLNIYKKIQGSQPVSPYIGIKAEQLDKNWKWTRLLHHIKNLGTNKKNFSTMYYLYSLGRKSREFLKKT